MGSNFLSELCWHEMGLTIANWKYYYEFESYKKSFWSYIMEFLG